MNKRKKLQREDGSIIATTWLAIPFEHARAPSCVQDVSNTRQPSSAALVA